MITSTITFKVGKRKFFKIDVVDLISNFFKMSKTEVRRLIKQGAIGFWIDTKDE